MSRRRNLWTQSIRFRLSLFWLLIFAGMLMGYYVDQMVAYVLMALGGVVRHMDSPVPHPPPAIRWLLTACVLTLLASLVLKANRVRGNELILYVTLVLIGLMLLEIIRRDILLFHRSR